MKQVSICLLIATTMSGCGMASTTWHKGGIAISTDAEGMHALGDTLIGIQTEAKNPRAIKSAYWGSRDKQETEITERETAPGFLTSLFSGGSK